jgi:hypothetical protein
VFKQYLYKLYLLTLALPLVAALIIIGWKKETLSANARICGLTPDLGFRIRFYRAAALDLLRFLHGHYGSPITSRPRDAAKIKRLRSGPSLLLTAHFHNWELMGGWMVRQGVPLLSAARPMAQGLSQTLLIRLRDRLGQKVIFEDVPRRALRHIQGGGCFGLVWDQRVPASKTRAPLFGRTLAMDPLPRFLTRNAAVPVFFGVLLPGGRLRILQIAGPRSTASDSKSTGAAGVGPGIAPETLSRSVGAGTDLRFPEFTPPPESPLEQGRSEGSHTQKPFPFTSAASTPRSEFHSGPGSDSDSILRPGSASRVDLHPAPNPSLYQAPLTQTPSTLSPPSRFIGLEEVSGQATGSEETDRLGRRYHRILECLVRAHPTSWYGLTHRRFLG